MLRLAAPFLGVLVLAGCFGSDDEATLIGIVLTAEPGGPSLVAGTGNSVPLDEAAALVPDPLPQNPTQVCGEGVRVSLRYDDGEVSEYGPCTLPPEIERLRESLVAEELRRGGLRQQPGGARCAKDVIADWYSDGHVDRVYALRCYSEALEMLASADIELPADLRRARAAAAVGQLAG